MEAKNADLAALRINCSPESDATSPRRMGRWLVIGLPAAARLVLAAVGLMSGGALGSALPVHLTPATTGVITRALVFAVVMGVVGGFPPAVRAARLDIVNALRAS